LSDECDVDIVGTWISEVTLSSCSGQCGVLGRQHQGGIRSLNVVQWARPFFPGPEAPELSRQGGPCASRPHQEGSGLAMATRVSALSLHPAP
jgi:hypothetical protein